MCAIVDANVASSLFRPARTGAAAAFFEWVNTGAGRLVVGGRLRLELSEVASFREWQQQAVLAGRISTVNDEEVEARTQILMDKGLCHSNDDHIIALAQISGARLLYSRDRKLHKDFGDPKLLAKPRGKIYSTLAGPQLRPSHKQLLDRSTCPR